MGAFGVMGLDVAEADPEPVLLLLPALPDPVLPLPVLPLPVLPLPVLPVPVLPVPPEALLEPEPLLLEPEPLLLLLLPELEELEDPLLLLLEPEPEDPVLDPAEEPLAVLAPEDAVPPVRLELPQPERLIRTIKGREAMPIRMADIRMAQR